jgi:putative membrane-bound dehydrogenase-like protein
VNFDDFRFHASAPNIPAAMRRDPPSPPDSFRHSGLPPEKAAAAMTVPEGFSVTLFAGEPDLHQPIAFCFDDRGRLWVVEAFVYPRRLPHPGPLLPEGERKKGDRILIFEDSDGDGKFDKKTVFIEGLNLVSGIEVGFGGVWIGAAPYLLFVPRDCKTDRPAGPPKILLDGWGWQDTHETLNAFTWGPDGWLYGCHGVFTHSRVGRPGTPDAQRVPINAGIWRYHPTRHHFEVFAHGTSNPWGLDFNDHGQAFVEACVIPHCFHIVSGGRYHRQAGQHFNPYTYADIQTIADHRHYLGPTPHGGNNRSDSAGGGHAHCGLMAYLGGSWPAEYRDQLFMGNIHGRRINVDVPRSSGSGYLAGHGKDFLLANDEWARFINLKYGPDGNVFLIDWYDKQACHRNEPEIWDRTNGRMYKISYRGTKPVTVDLDRCSNDDLVRYQLHANDWFVRHGRRILQERAAAGADMTLVHEALFKIALEHDSDTRKLRGLWALTVTGGFSAVRASRLLESASPHVRAWTARMILEDTKIEVVLRDRITSLAKSDPSPVVRLAIAGGLQRVMPQTRWPTIEALLGHGEDGSDQNLPLLYWYAAEPLAVTDVERALALAGSARMPQILPFMVRRVADLGTEEATSALIRFLSASETVDAQRTILAGIREGLRGRRQVAMPKDWPSVFGRLARSSDGEIRASAVKLALIFGDLSAFEALRAIVADAKADSASRIDALNSLLDAKDAKLPPLLIRLLNDSGLRSRAISGLAGYADPTTPNAILKVYSSLNSDERRLAVDTLASRATYARELLRAVGSKQIAPTEVSAAVIRQLRNLGDPEIDRRIGDVWGIVRTTPADRVKMMTQYRQKILAPGKVPDVHLGRAIFAKTCQQCHVLFGAGGKVGPDITGANRGDIGYLLENVLDPSAVIPKEYVATRIELKNGRVITGIVKEQNATTLTVVTATETLAVPRADVENNEATNTSMMPDDQLKPMSDHEVRSLFAYLQSPIQVPMLATAENAKDLFNGKDLIGWDGDPKLWSVEGGEIVGRSQGIKRNEFLKSAMAVSDFRLTLKVKLLPNQENSGIQFRSEVLPDGDVKGPQADIGAGWWGKLYEEHGRGILAKEGGEKFVRPNDWNEYEIEAMGATVRLKLNGHLCAEWANDSSISRRGIIAFQIHSGGPLEVRFKDIRLEVR